MIGNKYCCDQYLYLHEYGRRPITENILKFSKGTWTKKRLGIILAVAIIYGVWFDLLDSISYCPDADPSNGILSTLHSKLDRPLITQVLINLATCKPIGEIFGGNQSYQPWNVAGHFIPGLFLLFFKPRKWELFLAGFLISTAVMDSAIWGAERLLMNSKAQLWDLQGQTRSLVDWIRYYYNPVGLYGVWGHQGWIFHDFPNAATIFWSIVGRLTAAGLLIWYQNKLESEKKEELSLKQLFKRNKVTKK